jgi:hypothetical protein
MISSTKKLWFQRLEINCLTRRVLVRQIVTPKQKDDFSLTKSHQNIFNAFKQFKSVYGHCNVGPNFQILSSDVRWPEYEKGLKLGQLFFTIRNLNVNKVIKPSLVDLGFDVEPNIKYEDMRAALVKYKELEGHAQVPCDFRIPYEDNRYPENTRGLHLGFAVHTAQVKGCYEHHHDELKQLGVNFDIKSPKSVASSVIYDATVAFKSVHNHLQVPVRFIGPSLSDYDEAAWGLQLGLALYLIRADKLHADRKEDFLALGLDDSVQSLSDFQTVHAALNAYKVVHGDLFVPRNFVVPQSDARYPFDTWGMKLGETVYSIRHRGTYSEHRAKLEELGVNLETENRQKWDFLTQIYPALEVYKSIHGDLLVPQSFVVPHDDVNYPPETWGMKLGNVVSHIRVYRCHAQYKERLTALGFNYEIKPLDIRGFHTIYSALEAYKTVHGDLLVPQSFVVPRSDVRFPPDAWGMKLGLNVSGIRNKGVYSEHRAKLEELGFVFKKTKKVVELD